MTSVLCTPELVGIHEPASFDSTMFCTEFYLHVKKRFYTLRT
ncbi:MAG TPA: hypothetical protein PKW36_13530 [bacterium]|nr:hypothetical protein [bacterium]